MDEEVCTKCLVRMVRGKDKIIKSFYGIMCWKCFKQIMYQMTYQHNYIIDRCGAEYNAIVEEIDYLSENKIKWGIEDERIKSDR